MSELEDTANIGEPSSATSYRGSGNDFNNDLRATYRALRHRFRDTSDWKARSYAAPSPKLVKDRVLLRNGIDNATWVETGTFLGETTALLARHARHVFTLEPAAELYHRAAAKFSAVSNVTVINGPSETVFAELLPKISGPTNFWLDGHFSAGQTFQGSKDTPVMEELSQIQANLSRLGPVCLLIDDVRCFDPSQPAYTTYPPLDDLVDWARAVGLKWHIEHDIFVARSPEHA